MKQWLALLIVLIAGLLPYACKSSALRSQEASHLQALEVEASQSQTYASLASVRIMDSFLRFMAELDRNGETAEPSLEQSLLEFQDMLEIFVHVLPKTDEFDPFLQLHAELQEGKTLLSRMRRPIDETTIRDETRPAFVQWKMKMASARVRMRNEQYLNRLNQNTATRRTIPVLENFCWGQVNYIPRLQGPAVAELQAFMNALLNASRLGARDHLTIESILAENLRAPFFATERKNRFFHALLRYFPEVFQPIERVTRAVPTMKVLKEHYDQLGLMLQQYDRVRSKKVGERVKSGELDRDALEAAIMKEWALIQNLELGLNTL